jgi:two-component system OmpR family response regulator
VWDLAHDGDTNVVEVYIGYLRRKLAAAGDAGGAAGAGVRVETVRGAGYRLVADAA